MMLRKQSPHIMRTNKYTQSEDTTIILHLVYFDKTSKSSSYIDKINSNHVLLSTLPTDPIIPEEYDTNYWNLEVHVFICYQGLLLRK